MDRITGFSKEPSPDDEDDFDVNTARTIPTTATTETTVITANRNRDLVLPPEDTADTDAVGMEDGD